MTPSDPRVGEIQARLSAATPGPWKTIRHDLSLYVEAESGEGLQANLGYVGNRPDNDAEFIASAPADVAYLLAELRARDEALGRVEEAAETLETYAKNTRYNNHNLERHWEARADAYEKSARHIRAAVAAATGVGE